MSNPVQIELVSHSPEQTRALGRALAGRLAGGSVVALTGHLGAGKTQWVKGLAAGLGIDPDSVHSPTFTLINEYAEEMSNDECRMSNEMPNAKCRMPDEGRSRGLRLYHVDAYRLTGAAELDAIGFAEMVAAGDGIVAVEWADRVAECIPPDAVWIAGTMPANLGPQDRRYVICANDSGVLESLCREL